MDAVDERGQLVLSVYAPGQGPPDEKFSTAVWIHGGALSFRQAMSYAIMFDSQCHMAGYRITPVLGLWTLRVRLWEFLRLWTGFELPSSWANLPGYGPNLNRNILDFMK
jgi:hypothetical protein